VQYQRIPEREAGWAFQPFFQADWAASDPQLVRPVPKTKTSCAVGFSGRSPLHAGRFTPPTNSSTLRNAVQQPCSFLQNLALRAIASTPPAPAAGLGRAGVCTALTFAQKRDAKPVGGRGTSAFSADFFYAIFFCLSDHHSSILSGIPHNLT
jgi:hypothetical protein